ncbi:type I glyceraldehyde-3-phosphate dehydrogenase [Psychrobacter sp. AOP22-C1-22]|uniref:type I glyceraldehyde-3-phosphate dehydrogenase n=1 Tax=unclassified Psychrobacter TaxID=196806 RepID=UPI0017884202|nr:MULTISPECIES: type I glyceraldehyde-3-phosphate dehydrogenase [unclassified Psychrobacter]MDN5802404.1 glyceraldehyde-3-phosphate dehydrogenase [Psychrobacter sp.]MBE0406130.1 aldehyde dehydrogenase [Psychrobacter sp. FME6]MBE0444263.1 aldehyde dehydrogenase [Psychrobacter sp. FME5]MDN5891774.1 glyceraldehyde-3-phosphate dehydrogenase [Psychrobacter sp.]MDN5897860.1 glyceraldehyde-3-phosphate dehydrogenase [Psychrobacter sp.]
MPDFSSATYRLTSDPSVAGFYATNEQTQPLRVAINGFGRIGRNVLRALLERFEVLGRAIHVVAINDLAPAETLLHLLRFDSTHGRLSRLGVTADIVQDGITDYQQKPCATAETDIQLCLNKNNLTYCIRLLSRENAETLPWKDLQVDVVLECTGHYRSYEQASVHIEAGAKQVIIGAAPFDHVDASIVMGVNGESLTRKLPIISSVSCTTQALVPLIDTLDKAFGVKSAMMTEIHAVTADQTVLDQAHRDLRRARASGYNIIPTTSSSIAATERVLPNMIGKINGHSIRVPTIDVAAIDVNFIFDTLDVDIEAIREVLKTASAGSLINIMAYTDEPLVSSDFIHQTESLIIDGQQLMQIGEQYKVFAWYDNEWGYANRLLDMCLHLASSKS